MKYHDDKQKNAFDKVVVEVMQRAGIDGLSEKMNDVKQMNYRLRYLLRNRLAV